MACNICTQEKEDLAYIQEKHIEVLRDDRQLKDALDAMGKQEQLSSVSDISDCLFSTISKDNDSVRDSLHMTPSGPEYRVCSKEGNSSYCEQLLVCKTCRELILEYIHHQFSALDIKKNILKVMNKNFTDSNYDFNSCKKENMDECCRIHISTKKPSVPKSEMLASEKKIEQGSGKESTGKRKLFENSCPNVYVKIKKHKKFFTSMRHGKWLKYRKDGYVRKSVEKKRMRKKAQVEPEIRSAMIYHDMENSIKDMENDKLELKDEMESEEKDYTRYTMEGSTSVTNYEKACPFCEKPVENPGEFHNCSISSKYLTCQICFLCLPSLDGMENHLKDAHCLSSDKHCVNEGCNFSCASEGFLKWHYHLHELDPEKKNNNETCVTDYMNGEVNLKEIICDREDVIVQILEISDDELECSMSTHSDHPRNIDITLKDLDMDLVTQIETVVDQSEGKCLKSNEPLKEVGPASDISFYDISDSEKESGIYDNKNNTLQSSISSDMHKYHPVDVVGCSICLDSFTNFRDHHKHVESAHAQIQKWKCQHCNKLFEMEKALMIHSKDCIGHTKKISSTSAVKPLQIGGSNEMAQVFEKKIDSNNESSTLNVFSRTSKAKSCNADLETTLFTRLIKSSSLSSGSETDLLTDGSNLSLCAEGIKKRSHSQKSKIHNCQECGKVFRSYAHLMEHKVSHSDTKLYSCNTCHKKFKRKNALSKHTRTFHTGKSDLLICQCGKVFTSKDHLESHLHNTDFHQTFSCTFCNTSYKTKISLENHLLHHLKDKTKQSWPFTCKICGVKLSSILSLQTHENLKHGNESWKCEYCSQEFKIKNLLKQHIQRKHKIGEKEYQCHICNKIFYIQKDLKRHANSHNKTRVYKCPTCDATFRTLYGLQSHKRIHSGDRPYACHICSKTFLLPSHVKSHLASVHSLEVSSEKINRNSTHKCPVCERCFLYRTSLASHLNTHVGYLTVMDEDNEEVGEFLKCNEMESRQDICVIEVSQNSVLSKGSCNTKKTNLISNCKREPVVIKAAQVDNLLNIGETSLGSVNMNSKQLEHSLSRNLDEPSSSAVQRKTVEVECKSNDMVSLTSSDSSSFTNDESVQQALENALKVIEVDTLVTSEDGQLVTKYSVDTSGSSVIEQERNTRNALITSENSDGSFVEVEALSQGVDDVTKYICGHCSKVFTNTKLLKDHLLSCYVDDSSGDYVVVYEEDTTEN